VERRYNGYSAQRQKVNLTPSYIRRYFQENEITYLVSTKEKGLHLIPIFGIIKNTALIFEAWETRGEQMHAQEAGGVVPSSHHANKEY